MPSGGLNYSQEKLTLMTWNWINMSCGMVCWNHKGLVKISATTTHWIMTVRAHEEGQSIACLRMIEKTPRITAGCLTDLWRHKCCSAFVACSLMEYIYKHIHTLLRASLSILQRKRYPRFKIYVDAENIYLAAKIQERLKKLISRDTNKEIEKEKSLQIA